MATATYKVPTYTVYAVSGDTKFNLTTALVAVERSESKEQMAQRADLRLTNVQVNGNWLSGMLKARCRIFIYANDGEKNEEVFRGYLWARNYRSSISEHEISYTCYDNLIYLQESEDTFFFPEGKSTKDIMTTVCNKWDIHLRYSYSSITHSKLPLRGKLASCFTEDILEPVRKRTGKKYVILSDRDAMFVMPVGSNTTIYKFLAKKNVISTTSGWTMDGVITQVVIVGKADDDDRVPVEATVSGKTSEYGTLQKIQSRDENTSLADAKLEAKNTIDENGEPKWEYELTAPDIPWIRKGDKVYVDAGDIVKKHLIVTAVNRSSDTKSSKMTLTMENV